MRWPRPRAGYRGRDPGPGPGARDVGAERSRRNAQGCLGTLRTNGPKPFPPPRNTTPHFGHPAPPNAWSWPHFGQVADTATPFASAKAYRSPWPGRRRPPIGPAETPSAPRSLPRQTSCPRRRSASRTLRCSNRPPQRAKRPAEGALDTRNPPELCSHRRGQSLPALGLGDVEAVTPHVAVHVVERESSGQRRPTGWGRQPLLRSSHANS